MNREGIACKSKKKTTKNKEALNIDYINIDALLLSKMQKKAIVEIFNFAVFKYILARDNIVGVLWVK